jgi:hypothetical protein
VKPPRNVPESFKRRNPDLYPVGRLENPKRQPDKRSDQKDPGVEVLQDSVAYRVLIISCRHRLCDAHDNLRTGAKPLVDAITATLGFTSDDDRRLTWEYGQVISEREGTIVKIELAKDNGR